MIFEIQRKDKNSIACITDDGQILDYGTLCQKVTEMSFQFKGRKLVFLLCENTIETLCSYLAILEANSVPLLLPGNIDEETLQQYAAKFRPNIICMPQKGVCMTYSEENVCMHPDLALLLTTSGSTGGAKLVRLSLQNIMSNAKAIVKYLDIDEKERPITSLPMQYTYGLSVIHSHLLAGACLLLTAKSIMQQEFWDFANEREATSFSGVPYTYELLKRMRLLGKAKVPFKTMTQAGGKLSVALQKEMILWAKECGMNFVIMYGQTEATARMSYLPWEKCEEKLGSIGIAIPGGRFILLDESGKEIAASNVTGELIYLGENVSMGYANDQKELASEPQWNQLATGDMAYRDEEGYYYIVGRKKRFVKLYGIRVGLDDCEQMLRNRNPDCEWACIGLDDILYIITTDDTEREQVTEWMAERLHVSEKGIRICVLSEIMKNAAGKIQYQELEQQVKDAITRD